MKRAPNTPVEGRPQPALALMQRRLARGWSQTELADAVGISKQLISYFETGVRDIKPKYTRLLDAALKKGRAK